MSLSSVFVVGNALRLRGFKSGFAPGKVRAERGWDQPMEGAAGDQEEAAAEEAGTEALEKVVTGKTERDAAIGRAERKVTMKKVMTIEGMMCGHCTGRVQKALEALEGVTAVAMSLEEKTATVELGADVPDEALTAAVTEAGYEVKGIAAAQ